MRVKWDFRVVVGSETISGGIYRRILRKRSSKPKYIQFLFTNKTRVYLYSIQVGAYYNYIGASYSDKRPKACTLDQCIQIIVTF